MRGEDVPVVILEHWWECGRKVALATETIGWLCWTFAAVDIGRSPVKRPYKCSRCAYWHNGRPPKRRVRNERQKFHQLNNMRKAWDEQIHRRQYHWRVPL